MGFQDEQVSRHGEGTLVCMMQCVQADYFFWLWVLGVGGCRNEAC